MDRQVITFEANEQTLIKTGGLDNYSSNKVSYIEAHFALGQNWAGYDSVRAVWSTRYECISTVLDTEGICVVPYEVLKWKDKVIVNLVGSISEDDVLTDRITTYPIKALEVDADAKVCGSNTQPITPSEYEQFVEAVKADADRAEEAKDEARVYAGNALSSAQNALISETNASTSEDNAKASELNAETYKNQAQTYAQNANNSAISAENAKDEAEDARDTILGMRAEATTLPEGSSATASYNDGVMSFGIPKGDTGARGATGETGATPQLSIGTVETTTEPSVTITGTAENPVLNFGLVKGDKGDTGEVSLAEMLEQTTIQTNTDNEPYLFRATPECGRYELDEIVGGTVAWNQLRYDTLTTYTGEGIVTSYDTTTHKFCIENVSKTTNYSSGSTQMYVSDDDPIENHKYLLDTDAGTGVLVSMTKGASIKGSSTTAVFNGVSGATTFRLRVTKDYDFVTAHPIGDKHYFYLNIFDLTQMFGSTIADAIYAMERATAGSGVAWFRKFFGEDYYPYSSGELKSVEGLSAHIMRDVNNNVVGTYPLDDSLTLRGIPKLDANNKLYYDGDTYESNGTVTRKYGIVDLGTLNWNDYGDNVFRAVVNASSLNMKFGNGTEIPNVLVAKYVPTTYTTTLTDKWIKAFVSNNTSQLLVKDTAYTSASDFKTAMSGVYLVYELKTPTTETADPYQNPQRCEKGGTEEYVSTSIVPVGHNTDYPMTLEDTIPTTDGTYSLTVTVSGGKNTVSWS